MSDFFLWGGFVFSVLWHGFSWIWMKVSGEDTDKTDVMTIAMINLGLSGVALCGFGYLAGNTLGGS